MNELKPIEPLVITKGVKSVTINPNFRHIVFMSLEAFAAIGESFLNDPNNPLPAGTPVYVVEDIETAAKIYELLDTRVTSGSN